MAFQIRSEIIKNNRLFLVTSSPSNDNIDNYIKELKKRNIDIVIKLNEKNMYDTTKFKENNIDFIHIEIEDGHNPTKDNIIKLIEILNKYNNICMHCTAGLGRAPLIMSLILILQFNQDSYDTAIEIRKLIPNCLNSMQIDFIVNFKKNKYIKKKSCNIM
jgi:protein tyrosine phosphatase type 4A